MGPGAGARRARTGRRVARFVVTLAVGALMPTACGNTIDVSKEPPAEQCRDMIDAYCAKASECSAASDRTDVAEDCLFGFELQLACTEVTAILRSMNDCLDAIDAVDCDSFDPQKEVPPFPEGCRGVLGVR